MDDKNWFKNPNTQRPWWLHFYIFLAILFSDYFYTFSCFCMCHFVLAPPVITPRLPCYLLSLYPFCQTPLSGCSISALLGLERPRPEVIDTPCISIPPFHSSRLFFSPFFCGPFVIAAVHGTDICVCLELHLSLIVSCLHPTGTRVRKLLWGGCWSPVLGFRTHLGHALEILMKELNCSQLPIPPRQLPLLSKGQNVFGNRI